MKRETLYKVSYGLYVVSSRKSKRFNGQIANTVMQATSEPIQVAVCLSKQNLTHSYIRESKIYSVSILPKDTPMKFIGLFGFKSGRDIYKFRDVKFKVGKTGAPIIQEHTIGFLEVRVTNYIDVGTHTIFVGALMDADILDDSEPLTYEYYHNVLKGKTGKNAPTYLEREVEVSNKGVKMDKYQCQVCGYIYDPEIGDPDSGVEPGTEFDDLPDDWVCPVCGAEKSQFTKL